MERVYNPSIKAWGLWEIAARSGDVGGFERARQAAQEITEPAAQVHALARIAAAGGQPDLAAGAANLVEQFGGAEQAYRMAELAAATSDLALAQVIPDTFPNARLLAFVGLGEFEQAWTAAGKIQDPYDKARAQGHLVAASGEVGKAAVIGVPHLADRARRDVIYHTGNVSLVEAINSQYYQVQALTKLGNLTAAWDAAQGLRDTYPLVALAVAWVDADPAQTSEVVASIGREADKAVGLRVIAATTGVQADFERALGMALAARVRGDVLAPAEASLDLARIFIPENQEWVQAALTQAFDATERITIK